MVVCCSAPNCTNKKDNNNVKSQVQFHRFPLRKPDILSKWVKAMKNPNFKPTVTSYLCSAHFLASDYYTKPNVPGKLLKPNAVPSSVEKKRPGRKKKFLDETEPTEELKSIEECREAEEGIEEEYLEVGPTDKVQSNLAEIIGNEEKGTLHVLIVGEDGKITNSEYILKKEIFSDDESKQDLEMTPLEENGLRDLEEDCDSQLLKERNDDEKESQTEESENKIINFREMKNGERIKRLEAALMGCRKKVKVWQMKCKRRDQKINELKLLLKLLVLKRGKGEKNLKQLLDEYDKLEVDEIKMEVKEEECDF